MLTGIGSIAEVLRHAWSHGSTSKCQDISDRKGVWLKVASPTCQSCERGVECCRAVRDARSHGGVDRWRRDDSDQENLRQSIKSAVNEMFDKHNEVPFLAMYRKHVSVPSLLCLHPNCASQQ